MLLSTLVAIETDISQKLQNWPTSKKYSHISEIRSDHLIRHLKKGLRTLPVLRAALRSVSTAVTVHKVRVIFFGTIILLSGHFLGLLLCLLGPPGVLGVIITWVGKRGFRALLFWQD